MKGPDAVGGLRFFLCEEDESSSRGMNDLTVSIASLAALGVGSGAGGCRWQRTPSTPHGLAQASESGLEPPGQPLFPCGCQISKIEGSSGKFSNYPVTL